MISFISSSLSSNIMKVSINYNKKIIGKNNVINLFKMNVKEYYVKPVGRIANPVNIKINLVHLYTASSLYAVSQDTPMVDSMWSVGSDYITTKHIFKDSLIDNVILLILILNKFVSNYRVKTNN